MEEKLVFDKDMWDSLFEMIASPDEDTRKLALGMLENFDYTKKEDLNIFENFVHVCLGNFNIKSKEKGELVNLYFTSLVLHQSQI
jgi:hypothetical protein